MSSSITGSATYYAAGGGGSGDPNAGIGGSSIGGNGHSHVGGNVVNATAGVTNSGSGGGGGRTNSSGAGGSGVVIIRYITPSNYGTLYIGATNTTSADLAEYYLSGDKSIEAGDVVVISDTKVLDNGVEEVQNQGVLRKATKPYDSKLVGIISTQPGLVLGSIDGDTGQADKRMLALSGRAPVKIDPQSPPIAVGDFLTSSRKPGLAMKAIKAGYTIGKALESWQPGRSERIEVFIHLGWYAGDLTAE
jgi:hypothetical protein